MELLVACRCAPGKQGRKLLLAGPRTARGRWGTFGQEGPDEGECFHRAGEPLLRGLCSLETELRDLRAPSFLRGGRLGVVDRQPGDAQIADEQALQGRR